MPSTPVRTFRIRHDECDAYEHVNHANHTNHPQCSSVVEIPREVL
jgi:hypothetical protein